MLSTILTKFIVKRSVELFSLWRSFFQNYNSYFRSIKHGNTLLCIKTIVYHVSHEKRHFSFWTELGTDIFKGQLWTTTMHPKKRKIFVTLAIILAFFPKDVDKIDIKPLVIYRLGSRNFSTKPFKFRSFRVPICKQSPKRNGLC